MKKSKRFKNEAGIVFIACLFLLSGCVEEAGPPTIVKNEEGGYSLFVKGKAFLMKGVTYNPVPIGQGYEYDFFLDENKPWTVDGPLMQKMGVNCIRLYSSGNNLEKTKEFIRYMYQTYGIYTIVGDWLGLWECPGPNYADDGFRTRVKERIIKMVEALKDEEGVLFWVLGNENNYTCAGNITFWTSDEVEKLDEPVLKIQKRAQIYYSFVDELALAIKSIDQNHLVALGNGEATLLDVAARECSNIDALALIVYRGKKFGNFFNNVRNVFDKPIFISEFGADSYDAYKNVEDQAMQETFLVSQWEDLLKNTASSQNPQGNCLGGIVFEWLDEWWKHNEGYSPDWAVHNTQAGWSNGSYYFDIKAANNLNMNEEWFGLVALSEERENNINKRIPKRAYHALEELWLQ